jgi:hypothetical protein
MFEISNHFQSFPTISQPRKKKKTVFENIYFSVTKGILADKLLSRMFSSNRSRAVATEEQQDLFPLVLSHQKICF